MNYNRSLIVLGIVALLVSLSLFLPARRNQALSLKSLLGVDTSSLSEEELREELLAKIEELRALVLSLQQQLIEQKLGMLLPDTTLRRGSTGENVRRLQIFLNTDPDTRVAANGPGSLGNETAFFGSLTEAAVKRFQAKHSSSLALSGVWDSQTMSVARTTVTNRVANSNGHSGGSGSGGSSSHSSGNEDSSMGDEDDTDEPPAGSDTDTSDPSEHEDPSSGDEDMHDDPTMEDNPSPVSRDDSEKTLLSSYVVRHAIGPVYQGALYRPRQFTTAPYVGWDVLTLPGSTHRTYTYPDWLTLELNRDATLVVIWDGSAVQSWLNGWEEVDRINGDRAFMKEFDEGEVVLGAIGGTVNQPYTVLFAEADGTPSDTPSVPSGRSLPEPNEACPAWVHDTYTTTGRDGREYLTWHPQIDPVYWCYLGHTHFSDPSLLTEGSDVEFSSPYNYFDDKGGPFETNVGFRSEVVTYTNTTDGHVYRFYKEVHADTELTTHRKCPRTHTQHLAVFDVTNEEIVLDLHYKHFFGPIRDAATFRFYAPLACPENATFDTNPPISPINVPMMDNNGYETWQANYEGYPQLGISGAQTVAYLNPKANCIAPNCDSFGVTGEVDAQVWMITPNSSRGEGVSLHADTAFNDGGVFYTDYTGTKQLQKGDEGAVWQYIKPGIDVTLVSSPRFFSNDPWRYRFTNNSVMDFAIPNMNLEGGLKTADGSSSAGR